MTIPILNECPDQDPNVDPVTGKYVAPDYCAGTLDLSTSECANLDSQYIAALGAETLNIAAGPIHVYPLLGVHNQGSTVDLLQEGYALSSGTPAGYNVLDAFNVNDESWRSTQTGQAVLSTPSYLGYNFGVKLGINDIPKNAPAVPIKHQVQTIKLKQGALEKNRASQIRIEASNDGITWIRIDVINLMNLPDLITYGIKQSAMYQQWRIIPTMFNGVSSDSPWEVVQMQMLDDNQLSLDGIQDLVLMENRDRAYSQTSVCMKAQYDLIDAQTELTRFGIDLPKQYIFKMSFATLIKTLGRPIIIGDLIELPGEAQFDTQLRRVRQWLEVTDATWDTEGYTPNWRPTLYRFFAQPVLPSAEHRDVLGIPKDFTAQSDDDFITGGKFLLNRQAAEATEAIIQEASDQVPEIGGEAQDKASGLNMYHQADSTDQRDLFVQDGLPPDNQPFTEGETFPASPTDRDWHRLTYPAEFKVPARLYRWNALKNRWIYMEQDNRGTYSSHRPSLQRVLSAKNRKDVNK